MEGGFAEREGESWCETWGMFDQLENVQKNLAEQTEILKYKAKSSYLGMYGPSGALVSGIILLSFTKPNFMNHRI